MKRLSFLAANIAILAACCAPVDQSPIVRDPSLSNGVGFDGITAQATDLGTKYLQNAGNAANSAQVLELPIIGSAIAAAAVLAFDSDTYAALTAGVVGGSANALSNYYKPRSAAKVYARGAVAAFCIRGVAEQSQMNLAFVKSKDSLPLLESSGVTEALIIQKLENALDVISVKVFESILTETEPDLDAIVATVKANLASGDSATEMLAQQAGTRTTKSISKDDPRLIYLVRIDEQITNCKTKVGTS